MKNLFTSLVIMLISTAAFSGKLERAVLSEISKNNISAEGTSYIVGLSNGGDCIKCYISANTLLNEIKNSKNVIFVVKDITDKALNELFLANLNRNYRDFNIIKSTSLFEKISHKTGNFPFFAVLENNRITWVSKIWDENNLHEITKNRKSQINLQHTSTQVFSTDSLLSHKFSSLLTTNSGYISLNASLGEITRFTSDLKPVISQKLSSINIPYQEIYNRLWKAQPNIEERLQFIGKQKNTLKINDQTYPLINAIKLMYWDDQHFGVYCKLLYAQKTESNGEEAIGLGSDNFILILSNQLEYKRFYAFDFSALSDSSHFISNLSPVFRSGDKLYSKLYFRGEVTGNSKNDFLKNSKDLAIFKILPATHTISYTVQTISTPSFYVEEALFNNYLRVDLYPGPNNRKPVIGYGMYPLIIDTESEVYTKINIKSPLKWIKKGRNFEMPPYILFSASQNHKNNWVVAYFDLKAKAIVLSVLEQNGDVRFSRNLINGIENCKKVAHVTIRQNKISVLHYKDYQSVLDIYEFQEGVFIAKE